MSQQTSSTSLSDRPHDRPVKASYTLRETVPTGGGIGDTLAGRFVFAGCCVRRFVSSGKYYPVGKECLWVR
nr:MAG TPA: hypothetical protein [Caudoviricetes sp.]